MRAMPPLAAAHSTGLKQAAMLSTVPAAWTQPLLPFHHQPGWFQPHLTSKNPQDGSGFGGTGGGGQCVFGVRGLWLTGGFGVLVSLMKTGRPRHLAHTTTQSKLAR